MKVKIVKAKLATTYWYAKHIGEVFEVLDGKLFTKGDGTKAYILKKRDTSLINVDDCSIKERVIFD